MNELQLFNYENNEVRTLQNNEGDIWFCLKDVCEILEIKNVSDCKTRLKKDGVGTTEVMDSLGRKQKITIINESNLYKVIFQSRKPEAENFTDWVTSEVLPSIRKNGNYTMNAVSYAESLRLLADQVERNEKLAIENQTMKPKAEYFDTLVERNLLTNFRDTAKEFNVKQKDFIDFLIDHKYLYRDQKGKIKPYGKCVEKGLFKLKEFTSRYSNHTDIQTLITPKGRETFRLLIKSSNKLEQVA